ncbi:hypothetical protein B0H13DRAFT_1897597 [Mycena leptocephala]|nr:hypothetical protein B0H13DRAFT_1897597 [Mycena leptocephala]
MRDTSSIVDPSVDALQFRATRSGRVFSEWAEISARTIQLEHGQDENLAEPDSGPPTLALTAIQPATSSSSTSPMLHKTRCDRDKARSKLKRQAERTAAKAKADILLDARPHHPRHLSKPISPIKATFEMRRVRIASTGWIGLRDNGVAPEEDLEDVETGPSPTKTLPDFFGPNTTQHGFTYGARPIIDAKKKVWGVFGGMPDDPNFMKDVHDLAVEAMDRARADASLADDRWFHRCGNFPKLTGGNSYGGGQFEPSELDSLLTGHRISSIFTWTIWGRFTRGTSALNSPSCFSACTFNLGPHTCTLGHRDFGNLAFGWCAITAFGDFDYRKGGHLILWDCKLILEFPPGLHGGGLFRWVEHDFQTEEAYFEGLSREERLEKELGLQRAREGAAMFSTIKELQPRRYPKLGRKGAQIGRIWLDLPFPSTTTTTQSQSLKPNMKEKDSAEKGKKSDLIPPPPSRTPAARHLAMAKSNRAEEAEKNRIRMQWYRAMMKANPEAYSEQQKQAKKARAKYEESTGEGKTLRSGSKKREGARDYDMEWLVYQDERWEKDIRQQGGH